MFRNAGKKISGDITPAYSTINKHKVAHIYRLMPDAKVLFILRNPIDRAWSHAIMDRAKRTGRSVGDVPEQEYTAHFHGEPSRVRSNYLRTLENWAPYREKRQLKIGFFDDLTRCPMDFLLDICKFLGVHSSPNIFSEDVHRKVNVGRGSGQRIPEPLNSELRKIYAQDIECLGEEFDGWPREWAATLN